jgi:type I restriction enzyme S subunit
MSKLDKLLRKLCPDGVEYKRFDEVCTLNARIGWQRLTKAEYMSKGDYLLITGTDFTETHEIDYSTCVYVTEERYKQDPKIQLKNGDILITKDGTLGKVAQVKGLEMPATLNGGVFVVRCKDSSLENRFILHYLLSNHFQSVVEQQKTGSTISHLTQTLFSRLMIPIPPLEIQREIVRILDNFTNLTAELTKELTDRKVQYAYYRNKFLYFDESSASLKSIGDICNVVVGGEPPADCIKGESKDSSHMFPVWGNGKEAYGYSGTYKIDRDAVVISSIGANTGAVYYRKAFFTPIIRLKVVMPKDNQLSSRFLFHVLSATAIKSKSSSVPNMNANEIKAIKIPVPPLDVQNRIVNVLDNFEKICSDRNIGLPAEIEARQKQYEYYRDKLLTFAETGNTILSRAEQSRAEQSRAEQSRALIKLLQYVFGYAVVTLEDIAENCDSMRKPVTSGKREAGEYPYYGASGIVDYVKDYIFDGDYLLVSEDGANLLARSTPIAFSISGKNWVNNHAHVLKFDRYETRRFVEFYLNSIDLAPYISGGAQPKLNQKNLNRIEIPLPGQKRQKYIVDILDRFDAICNDLTSGLPAEIEARQKQYEYYRDRLLSFKELN